MTTTTNTTAATKTAATTTRAYNDQAAIVIYGNLTKAPTLNLRDTANGEMAVANFTVATSSKNSAGIVQRMFFDCAVWGEAAYGAAKLQKGDRINLKGLLRQPRTWTNQETGEIMISIPVSVRSYDTLHRVNVNAVNSAAAAQTETPSDNNDGLPY